MRVDEVLARAGATVAYDSLLQIGGGQGTLQQRIVQQIELAGGQIIGGAPIGIDLLELRRGQRRLLESRALLRVLVAGLAGAVFFLAGINTPPV